eukprot:364362-Chlamydomonas_euryale.AAC.10
MQQTWHLQAAAGWERSHASYFAALQLWPGNVQAVWSSRRSAQQVEAHHLVPWCGAVKNLCAGGERQVLSCGIAGGLCQQHHAHVFVRPCTSTQRVGASPVVAELGNPEERAMICSGAHLRVRATDAVDCGVYISFHDGTAHMLPQIQSVVCRRTPAAR